MLARFITLTLIAVLALPVATLTRPADSSSPWGEVAVVAKGKKHKKGKKPQAKNGTRTVRETVTQTFTSSVPLTIPTGAPSEDKGKANPYPTTIAVSGFSHGVITDVNLILNDVTHVAASDLDVLLSASNGRRALVMSDVDSPGGDVLDVDLVLDDEAAVSMPAVSQGEVLVSGTYRPTNHDFSADDFAAPAPVPDGNVALSVFDGTDPNETWQLWVMDNAANDYGDLAGWALQITAETDIQAPGQGTTKAKPHKKKGKKRH